MSILKKAKLKLTVDLLNNNNSNVVTTAKESLLSLNGIGRFLGITLQEQKSIDEALEHKSYAMRFENATLNLDMISNSFNNTQAVSKFNLY